MIPRLVAKLKEFERRKAAKALIARRLLTFVWRRRIRKLKELKRKEQEQARRDAAMSSKLKKAAGKKDKGKKAAGGGGGSTRHLLPHEIMEVIPSPRDAAKGALLDGLLELAAAMDPVAPGGGAFFLGDEFSLLEVALLPWCARRLEPRLAALGERC